MAWNHVEGREHGGEPMDGAPRKAVAVIQAKTDESWEESREIDGMVPLGREKLSAQDSGKDP